MRIFKCVILVTGILLLLAGHGGLSAVPQGTAAPPAAPKQIDDKTSREEVDRIVREAMSRRHIGAAVVGMLKNSKVVVEKAYGKDPLYSHGENDKSVAFALGPASEILTGYAALVLVGDGRLSLADPAVKYIPTLPEKWRSITVEQLLAHTSGVPDFPLMNQASFAAALAEAGKAPLLFPPGTGHRNTYSDFAIVGQVIQAVAGQPYLKFMNDSVFKRLKMNTSGDLSLLPFRHSMSQDEPILRMPSQSRQATGQGNTQTGRQPDLVVRDSLLRTFAQVLPEYAIPSEGLAANVGDVLKLLSTLSSDSVPGIPASTAYATLAPGWIGCRSGNDVLLTAFGISPAGYGAILDLLPQRKTGWALLWKLDRDSSPELLADERKQILEKALGVIVSEWNCSPEISKQKE